MTLARIHREVVALTGGAGILLATCLAAAQPAMLDKVGALGKSRVPATLLEPQNVRTHGFILDMRNRIQLSEFGGWMTLRLQTRERTEGGPFSTYNPVTGQEDPVYRMEQIRDLVRIRSEVLVPAPPNYVRNPGELYRITLEGITIAPDYSRTFEVVASEALDVITEAWEQMMVGLTGTDEQAMLYGRILALQLLNESGYLPARIPITVLRSSGGLFRISGPTMGRMEVGRLDRFGDVEEGTGFSGATSEEGQLTSLTLKEVRERTTDSEKANVPRPGRSQVEQQFRYSREDMRPNDPRKEMFRQPGEQTPRSERIGARGRPLTVPEVDYPATSASDIDNFKLLTGESESALTAKGLAGD